MASFQQFNHSELSTSLQGQLPDSLRFDRRIRDEGMLIRLLLGTSRITENTTGLSINQKHNYSILPLTKPRLSKKIFTDFLKSGYGIQNLDNYLKKSPPANTKFHRELLTEFSCYFYNSHKGAHTLAFLNLYRILEHVSYSFPLVFAGRAKDYIGTFKKLQGFFNGAQSELKFFDHFINDLFDSTTLDAKLKINITAFNADIREKYYQSLKRICDSAGEITLHGYTKFTELEIDYRSLMHLIVGIRNRYFHFLSGSHQNISSTEIIDPDSFFKCLCTDVANWIAVIYFEIIKTEIEA